MKQLWVVTFSAGIVSCGGIAETEPPVPTFLPFNETQHIEIWIEGNDYTIFNGDVYNASISYCIRDTREPDYCGLRILPPDVKPDAMEIIAADDSDDIGAVAHCLLPEIGIVKNDLMVLLGCKKELKDAFPLELFEVRINNETKSATVQMPANQLILNKDVDTDEVHVGTGEELELTWNEVATLSDTESDIRLEFAFDDDNSDECKKLGASKVPYEAIEVDDVKVFSIPSVFWPASSELPDTGCNMLIRAARITKGVNVFGEILGQYSDSKVIKVWP